MLHRLACFILASLPLTAAAADVIYLTDGRTLRGEITEYVNGVVRFNSAEDKDGVVALSLVSRIEFGRPAEPDNQTLTIPPPPAYEAELQALIKQTEKRLKAEGSNSAAIAMYLDTEAPGEAIPGGAIDYRCYRGAGYSGMQRAPVGAAWAQDESVGSRDDGVRRVEIDPGPPYAIINRTVTLSPGEVTNLGRIALRKVIADKPVSLSPPSRARWFRPARVALALTPTASINSMALAWRTSIFPHAKRDTSARCREFRSGTRRKPRSPATSASFGLFA